MKASVVYVSNTGNTESLAMAIREELQNCLHCGAPANEALAADLVFAGFWTDRGTCPEELRDFLGKLHGKTVALFGTAGFGGAQSYFDQILDRAKLSRQTGFNSGAEVQIPYLLILSSALLLIYNQRVNSTRLVFIDEPFAKMDPGNVKLMLKFMREQRLQVIFCSPDKTESIGNECEVILPALRVRADSMQLGIVQFYEENGYGR